MTTFTIKKENEAYTLTLPHGKTRFFSINALFKFIKAYRQ